MTAATQTTDRVDIEDGLAFLDRVVVVLNFRYTTIRGEPAQDFGTGFLVKIGGTVFVLTAGHHLLERQASEINILVPNKLVVYGLEPFRPMAPQATYEPDVGYLEVSESEAGRLRNMTPILEEDIDVRPPQDKERLCLMGAPGALRSDSNQRDPEHYRGLCAYVHALSCPGNPCQRGFHVYWGDELHLPDGAVMPMPAPEGVSGAPVFRPHPKKPGVVGIASARFGDDFERCEHIRSAIELLADHPRASVREAAKRILSRARPPPC